MPADVEGPASFRIDHNGSDEEIVIPSGRTGAQVLFLAICLVVWPLIAAAKWGVAAVVSNWTALWFALAASVLLVLIYALLQIAWWVGGSERLSVINKDLRVRHTIFGLPVATRAYRGRDIRFFAATDLPTSGWLKEPSLPFFSSSAQGRLKFFFAARTVYLGHDLTADDAGWVAKWLADRLPASASKGGSLQPSSASGSLGAGS